MTQICPQCGTSNRAGARFCSKCRAPLPAAAPPPPSQPTPHTPPAPETRAGAPVQANAAMQQGVPGQPPKTTPLQEQPTANRTRTLIEAKAPKESAETDKTERLTALQTGFTLLPQGALLRKGEATYVVIDAEIDEPEVRHFYVVEQLDVYGITCPQCGHVASDQAESYCVSCGFGLAGLPVTATRFAIEEYDDGMRVRGERDLLERNLSGQGLLLPKAYFAVTLWDDHPRHYLLYPERPAGSLKLASELPRPQPLERVLGWGVILARGLASLHAQQIAHCQISPKSIVVSGDDAWLTGFGKTEPLKKKSSQEAGLTIGQDILSLAVSLQDLLGGPNASLPPEVDQVLKRGRNKIPGQFFTSAKAFGDAIQETLENLSPQDLRVRVGRLTNVGVVRDHNEDFWALKELSSLNDRLPYSSGAYVVADGMGGHAAGEIASKLAAKAALAFMSQAAEELEQAGNKQMAAIAREACLAANRVVFQERKKRGSDMGTTIVVALRIGDRLALGNIGDSRGYLINAQGIKQITKDHSLVQSLIDAGQITGAEARVHPQRNLIYKVVGDKPDIEPDTFTLRLQPGDRLLLCSDGLSGMVDDRILWETVMANQSPQAACDRLIELANQAGGEDNITAIIVQAD